MNKAPFWKLLDAIPPGVQRVHSPIAHKRMSKKRGPGLCRLCGQKRTLIKAHVIPKAFFTDLMGSDPVLFEATNRPGARPKRSREGVYDDGILCRQCENRFDTLDAYGAEVLLHRFQEYFDPLVVQGELAGWVSHTVDQARMRLFLISVLWRASVSTHPFFAKVQLGRFEEVAARMIKGSAVEPADDAAFVPVLLRWVASPARRFLIPTIQSPRAGRKQGANTYHLYLGMFVVDIQVDRRLSRTLGTELAIGVGARTLVAAKSYDTSEELGHLGEIFRNTPPDQLERIVAMADV